MTRPRPGAALDAFFRDVAPLLDGSAPPPAVARTLYGAAAAGSVDAERLAIYARFCRAHRYEALDRTFVYLRRAVIARGGEAAWEALVDEYWRRHPMRHFELNENGAAFPSYLEDPPAGAAAIPEWLVELADFEWWEWRTRIAPGDALDEEPARDPGPLRIASTVELRPYRYDLLGWIERGPEGDDPPARADAIVIFWRDRDLDARRERAEPEELVVLKAVHERAPLPPGSEAVVADLHAAGILLGAPPAPAA